MTASQSSELPLADIQGIILDDYFEKRMGFFVLFQIADPNAARAWLKEFCDRLTSAQVARDDANADHGFYNVAFSHCGLKRLGLEPAMADAFPYAFVEDSRTPSRSRILGDVGENSPDHWQWGTEEKPVHLAVLAYFKDADEIVSDGMADFIQRAEENYGLELIKLLDTKLLADNKEHFGFRDLIAQPKVGQPNQRPYRDGYLAPGEFLLGYENGYNNGSVGNDDDVMMTPVPRAADGSELGVAGSYLVIRQLEQDVVGFWKYCVDHGLAGQHQQVPYPPVSVASKMVGRWPSGQPLVKHWDPDAGADNADPGAIPAEDQPMDNFHSDLDDFTYEGDPDGTRCPFGSHLRRSNPRNWELGETPEESLRLSNLHRILRRGRTYGPPLLDEKMDTSQYPELVQHISDVQQKSDAGEDLSVEESELLALVEEQRGLHFMCFNADIERQFEFTQQQWCNNSKFAGLNSDSDPLIGWHEGPEKVGIDPPTFTIPAKPLRYRSTDMKRFVTVKGSGYFFMPSISDVRHLSEGKWSQVEEELEPATSDSAGAE